MCCKEVLAAQPAVENSWKRKIRWVSQKKILKGAVEIDFEAFIKNIDPEQAAQMIVAIDKAISDFDYTFDFTQSMTSYFVKKYVTECNGDFDLDDLKAFAGLL